jgi:hypothetical protein
LLGKDHPSTALFLAMARWRQGNRDEARAQFDRAVAAARKFTWRDDEMYRLRAEAAALIDLKPPPTHRPEK